MILDWQAVNAALAAVRARHDDEDEFRKDVEEDRDMMLLDTAAALEAAAPVIAAAALTPPCTCDPGPEGQHHPYCGIDQESYETGVGDERRRWRAAIAEKTTTLQRPGMGRGVREGVEVVLVRDLADLLDGAR